LRVRRVTGTVSSYAHLSVAGSAAADSAFALGKVRRHRPLTPNEETNLRAVAESFRSYSVVLGGGASYLAVVAKQRPTDTLAEVAVLIEGYESEDQASEDFQSVAGNIDAVARGESLDPEALDDLHQLFRKVTKHINSMLSGSGERTLQNSLR